MAFERNCQNRSVTPKTIDSNGYKNLLSYIRNITIMVAFRNKLSRRPHGVQSYGYIIKGEDFPVVFERIVQNRSVTPKTIDSNGYKNLLRYIRNITIMVTFRNKLFRRPPRGLIVWIYQETGRFSCGVRAQLPKSKCYTKNYWLEWVQESVKIHTKHNYYGGIP